MIIVSVSTTGRRIAKILPTLQSIRDGAVQPDKFILWLNQQASPVGPGVRPEDVPPEVERLCEVRWCENYGPATKLLPAMRDFPRETIATLDDDYLYPAWWLEMLTQGAERYPERIVCYRARRIAWNESGVLPYNKWALVKHPAGPSDSLVPTGVHGVLYPPDSLRPEVFDMDLLRRYSLPNDDLWFAVMRRRDPAVVQRGGELGNRRLRGPRLSRRNCRGRNDKIIRGLAERFGPWAPWHGVN